MKQFDVGNRKQLFIDERFVLQSRGVRLTVNPPIKRERVIVPEKPWESVGLGYYGTILEDEGIFKLWYEAYLGTAVYADVPVSVCYATSEDGLHWHRPAVNLFDWRGHRENNIVMPGVSSALTIIDPLAKSEHRYKSLGVCLTNPLWPESTKMHWDMTGGGVYTMTSPDGLRWKSHLPVASPFFHDSQPTAFYDHRLKKYVVYFRTHRKGRTLSRIEVDDLLDTPYRYRQPPATMKPNEHGLYLCDNFGAYDLVMACDENDPPNSDLQIMPIVQYPWADDVYLGMATIFRHYPEDQAGVFKNDGPQDVQLAVSRDGIRWERPQRKPYIPLGPSGSWDGGCIWPTLGMIRRGDEIWQYYGATYFTHGDYGNPENPAGGLCRIVQRLDGFVSIDSDHRGGEFTTPVLAFSGGQLELNVDCSAQGHVRVELLDESDRPIAGFTAADAIPVEKNHIAAKVAWKSSSDLHGLEGRSIKLRFSGKSFKLYAFQFTGE